MDRTARPPPAAVAALRWCSIKRSEYNNSLLYIRIITLHNIYKCVVYALSRTPVKPQQQQPKEEKDEKKK
jgi:hypothetical protein